jgi:outer membrane protein, heavy metal efflux system
MVRCLAVSGLVLIGGVWIERPAHAQSRLGAQSPSTGTASPGLDGTAGAAPSPGPSIYGGPPGASVGRYQPRLLAPPRINVGPSAAGEAARPTLLPERNIPVIRPLRPGEKEPESRDEGPPSGITLEEAVRLLIRNNLELQARFSDVPQAEADVLTSSLRTNPILYADASQVPYGSYSNKVAGGPVQYDVNLVYPLDLSHKRRARTRSAEAARQVVEASYKDTVRLTIDNLYKAYIDALVAQVNYDRATGKRPKEDLLATIPVDEPASALWDAQRPLAMLLNIHPAELAMRQLRGRLEYEREEEPKLPSAPDLVRVALANRPDLDAQRLAVSLADANVRAVMANRLDDVLLLYQPYTFHDGRPFELKNSLAWTLGVTIPLPLYNRQQGNLQRARLIAGQARTRLARAGRGVGGPGGSLGA